MTSVPMTEPRVLARLNQDHQRMRRVLEALEHQLQALVSGGAVDYALLREVLDYFRSFPDAVHHPAEDVLFDYMLNGKLSDEEAELVRDNRDQHEQLIAATEALLEQATLGAGGGALDPEALKQQIRSYVDEQKRHMHFEQEYLFPLADAKLSAADWDEIDFEETMIEDPLFDTTERQFEILREHIVGEDASSTQR